MCLKDDAYERLPGRIAGVFTLNVQGIAVGLALTIAIGSWSMSLYVYKANSYVDRLKKKTAEILLHG